MTPEDRSAFIRSQILSFGKTGSAKGLKKIDEFITAQIREMVEEAKPPCAYHGKVISYACKECRDLSDAVAKAEAYEDAAKIANPEGIGGDKRYHEIAEIIAFRIRARAKEVGK